MVEALKATPSSKRKVFIDQFKELADALGKETSASLIDVFSSFPEEDRTDFIKHFTLLRADNTSTSMWEGMAAEYSKAPVRDRDELIQLLLPIKRLVATTCLVPIFAILREASPFDRNVLETYLIPLKKVILPEEWDKILGIFMPLTETERKEMTDFMLALHKVFHIQGVRDYLGPLFNVEELNRKSFMEQFMRLEGVIENQEAKEKFAQLWAAEQAQPGGVLVKALVDEIIEGQEKEIKSLDDLV